MGITIQKKKKTKTPIKLKPTKVNTYILVDSSGSMGSYSKQVIDLINNQLENIRNNDLDIVTSLYTFDTQVTNVFEDVKKKDLQEVTDFRASGGTALNDALNMVLNPYSKEVNQLVIITDGQENSSRTSTKNVVDKIKKCLDSDYWTIGFCCPQRDRDTVISTYQIPPGSVQVWDTTVEGVKNLNKILRTASTTYYGAVKRGVLNTKSAYFSPDLDITKTEVKKNLDNVTNKYYLRNVANTDDLTASSFVTSKGFKFVVGCLYYQLTKKETLQDYKNIVLMRNSDKTLYSGSEVRNILSIPEGWVIQINPSFSSDWTVFVRSTSWNRKLVPGTKVLIQK